MSEHKKSQGSEEFRRLHKNSKTRDLKSKLHTLRGKEVFLTDTQTSDYTKSSGDMNGVRVQFLEAKVKKLEEENKGLRQSILGFKKNEFYQINTQKLRQFIQQNERLKSQVKTLMKDLQQSLIERDFLRRYNKNLKTQCQTLTTQLLQFKSSGRPINQRRQQKGSGSNGSLQDLQKVFRSASSELILSRRRQKRKKQQFSNAPNLEQINSDYFNGKTISKLRTAKY